MSDKQNNASLGLNWKKLLVVSEGAVSAVISRAEAKNGPLYSLKFQRISNSSYSNFFRPSDLENIIGVAEKCWHEIRAKKLSDKKN